MLVNAVAFYKSYHSNRVNQWIHLVCIPLIFFTGFIFLSYTEPIALLGGLNWSSIVALVYITYYLILELPSLPVAGVIASSIIVCFKLYGDSLTMQHPVIWKPALAVHLLSWLIQFYGHAVHEKRSPALIDNLAQAFLSAPFFVLLECMFSMGYRRDMQEKIDVIVVKNIKEFNGQKGKASAKVAKNK
jgi:uncharacterized membrane protein YGL010W